VRLRRGNVEIDDMVLRCSLLVAVFVVVLGLE
jgi:hypothetical protein